MGRERIALPRIEDADEFRSIDKKSPSGIARSSVLAGVIHGIDGPLLPIIAFWIVGRHAESLVLPDRVTS